MSRALSNSKGNGCFLWKRCSIKGPAQLCRREFTFAWNCGRKLRVPLELPVDLGDPSFYLREVRSPLALEGPPGDSSRITAGNNRASSRDEAGTSVLVSISDFDRRVSTELEQEIQASSCDEFVTPLAS